MREQFKWEAEIPKSRKAVGQFVLDQSCGNVTPISLEQTSQESPNGVRRDFCKAAASLWNSFLGLLVPGTSLVVCLVKCVLFPTAQTEVSQLKALMTGSVYPHYPPRDWSLPLPCAGSTSPVATHNWSGFYDVDVPWPRSLGQNKSAGFDQGRRQGHIAGDTGSASKNVSLTEPETAGADDMALELFLMAVFPSRSFWLFFLMLDNNLAVAGRVISSRGCCISVDTTV